MHCYQSSRLDALNFPISLIPPSLDYTTNIQYAKGPPSAALTDRNFCAFYEFLVYLACLYLSYLTILPTELSLLSQVMNPMTPLLLLPEYFSKIIHPHFSSFYDCDLLITANGSLIICVVSRKPKIHSSLVPWPSIPSLS